MARLATFALVVGGLATPDPLDVRLFLEASSTDERLAQPALDAIGRAWSDDYASLVLDLLRFTRPARARLEESDFPLDPDEPPARPDPFPPPGRAPPDPTTPVRDRLIRFLEKRTGQRFGHDLKRWRLWAW